MFIYTFVSVIIHYFFLIQSIIISVITLLITPFLTPNLLPIFFLSLFSISLGSVINIFPILNKSDTVREFLNEFHNKSKLIDAIRIYDRLAILLEFSKLRDSVINDKFLEFIKQKRYGVSAAEKIFNLNLRNATLPQ